MEITINNYNPNQDLVEAVVHYRETVDGHGFAAQVNVWVKASDSRKEIRALAAEAAQKFLQRAISAQTAANPPQ
jgi:hypothetical protein